MQVYTTNKSEKSKQNIILNSVLLVTVVVLISGSIGYIFGYQMGKRAGAKQLVKSVTDYLNPAKALSDSAILPETLVGKVTSLNGNILKIKLNNGDEKQVTVNYQTKVTQKDNKLKLSDIKSDSNVTVFVSGKDKNKNATRIIIR